MIDFDLKETDGQTSLSEILKLQVDGQQHMLSSVSRERAYIFIMNTSGDPTELAPVYSEGIEIKVYTGDASLRRQAVSM